MNHTQQKNRRLLPLFVVALTVVIFVIVAIFIVAVWFRSMEGKQLVTQVTEPVGTEVIIPTETKVLLSATPFGLNESEGDQPQIEVTVTAEGPSDAAFAMDTPIPTEASQSISPQILEQRPYSDDSPWNTPIGTNPQYDPYSDEMIATIGLGSDGLITSDPTQYSYPVYYADETTPRWDIPCTRYKCTVVTPDGVSKQEELKGVPIPTGAQPSVGSDGQMIIIDKLTYAEYDLWEVKRTRDGWSVSNGSVYNITWNGAPSRYGSRGAGVPYLAGLIRPFEIVQGRIEHALAFGYSYAASDRCVYPASKTDGKSDVEYAIPQGARIQLDPTLTEADFDRLGLSRTGKIIARALQEYGMILIDNSGRPKIYAEDLINNPFSKVQWTDPELSLDSKTPVSLPFTSFRVLKLPESYWNEGTESLLHGECFVD